MEFQDLLREIEVPRELMVEAAKTTIKEIRAAQIKHRWIDCPGCGLSLDRDHNAAINILKRGLQSLGGDGQSLWAPSSLMSEGLAQEAAGF